jgi:hypothetical protein
MMQKRFYARTGVRALQGSVGSMHRNQVLNKIALACGAYSRQIHSVSPGAATRLAFHLSGPRTTRFDFLLSPS